MRPPDINLARRPFRNNSVYYAVFVTCFLLLALATGYNVYDFVTTGKEMARLQEVYGERQQKYLDLREEVEKMKKEVNGLDLATLNAKSAFANGLILSRLFSWSMLFDRLEDLIPPNVRIRSIRPSISAKGIEIQIDGMARTPEDLYTFEQSLVNSDFFSAVYPVSENSKESRGEINFDLSMNYVPGGRNPVTTASMKLPATPTEGLPQKSDAAGAGPADPNVPAGTAPGPQGGTADQTTGTAAAPPQAAAQAPAAQPPAQAGAATGPAAAPPAGGPPPETAASEQQAEPLAPLPQPLTPPPKPPRELTNKEFIDWGGQERFVRIRGGMRPSGPSKDAALTNAEFIKKYGMEEFLKARGDLKVADQKRPSQPDAGGQP